MKLLVVDLEGTIFRTDIRLPGTSISSTIWQGIANALGPEAIKEEVATHERWARKQYRSYIHWMEDTIAIHIKYGLTEEIFDRLISSAEYNDAVPVTLAKLDRTRYEPVIVSGGFRELARRAQSDLSIRHAFCACEYIFGEDSKLKFYNLLPCDFEGKIDFIRLMLREYKLTESDWVFVGDGATHR
ncbi:MAG TPA: HAD family hydrolase [Candidatus Binatia bacterium]|jgi:phosphoserine phosphatase|nr:HAD family hydrolase [Candidatus Binatia bacterium]